ncbi:MAG: FAD binding domain-containing protein, partial [Pseudomonadota bacterium]
PVQEAMIAHHGSQCGFCTPGFITTMACAHLNKQTDYADQIAGNLCRCTGYAPILKAAQQVEDAPVPPHMRDAPVTSAVSSGQKYLQGGAAGRGTASPFLPQHSDDVAAWYLDHPHGTLIAGATDVGLWVTKQFRELGPMAFLAGCDDLKGVHLSEAEISIGAMTDMETLRHALAPHHPDFAEMLRRYGSVQVRSAATLGGNIANGSPIGDSPPPLIALDATLHLRCGDDRRSLRMEDFFLDYGKQDRRPGEFVERVTIPRQPDTLHVFKLSKRFDQDISAVCGAFNLPVQNGRFVRPRLAFGGMAGVPKRASHVEALLDGQPMTEATLATAQKSFAKDFSPLSDMRASSAYRLAACEGMVARAFHRLRAQGQPSTVLEVAP